MGETRVDLQHLLEDLRDAYTGALEQTILTEVVANALDSGASRIRLLTNPKDAALTVIDNGRGMQRRELARYHDVAASTKTRGEGIGFAGVGIKLGLLVSREVVTETRRGATAVATRWHLASRHRAPWKWIAAPGLTGSRGTAVRLTLASPLSPLVDAGYIEEVLRTHFEPLFDAAFDDLLRAHYRQGVAFDVDGRELARVEPARSRATIAMRLGRRRKPSAAGFLERGADLPASREGVAISTYGKVIKRGWDWLGLTPPPRVRVGGVIEAPELAACLTLSKNDFIRTGARGATYLAYRKAIQEVVSRQLAAWGDTRDDEPRPKTARLERDLERVLEDLADEFPLLRSLVERRRGGQRRLPMPGRGAEQVPAPLFADLLVEEAAGPAESGATSVEERDRPNEPADEPTDERAAHEEPGGRETNPGGTDVPPATPAPATQPPDADAHPGRLSDAVGSDSLDTIPGRRRPARYGLLVQFESRPDDPELGRLVESTVWINDAHPAFARAMVSRSLGYHTALAVALSLAPLAVGSAEEHAFITQFLARWGSSSSAGRPAHRRRRVRRPGSAAAGR